MARDNDGQHYDDQSPAPNNGQRIITSGRVGQQSGGEQAMSVPKPRCGVDIDTTTMSGGPRSSGESKRGVDD